MRGIPGSGKSTAARELCKSLGGTPQGHIFSSDDYFNPISYQLRHLVHATEENLSIEKAVELVESIKKMWFGAAWTKAKEAGQSAFIEFKTLADQGKYYEAIQFAQQIVDTLEFVEYHNMRNGTIFNSCPIPDNIFRDVVIVVVFAFVQIRVSTKIVHGLHRGRMGNNDKLFVTSQQSSHEQTNSSHEIGEGFGFKEDSIASPMFARPMMTVKKVRTIQNFGPLPPVTGMLNRNRVIHEKHFTRTAINFEFQS